jgi:hypothetical protein
VIFCHLSLPPLFLLFVPVCTMLFVNKRNVDDFMFCYMRDESTGKEVKKIERSRPFLCNTMFLGAFSSGSSSL